MSPRPLKILCAVSILLNIFLLGTAIGGAAWLHTRAKTAGGSIRVAGADLPPDQRRAFRRAMHEARLEMRPTILAGRQAREDAAVQLRAPTLDQAALDAALARVRAADFAIRTHIEARAIAFAATLTLADRETLAEGIVRRPRLQNAQQATGTP